MIKNNKFYIMLWSVVIVLVLPWDQEKIVVINLILFCFFLYYMVSKTVEDAFAQKKQVVNALLKKGVDLKIMLFIKLLDESIVVNRTFDRIVLNLLVKIQRLTNTNSLKTSVLENKTMLASYVKNFLVLECGAQNTKAIHNLFVVKQLKNIKLAALRAKTLNLE